MKNAIALALFSIVLIADGLYGAYVSRSVRESGWSWKWMLLSGFLAQGGWILMVKFSKVKLIYASLFYEIVYNLAWFGFLVMLGDQVTLIKKLGIGLVILGLAMVGL
jgi:hypothetical protein